MSFSEKAAPAFHAPRRRIAATVSAAATDDDDGDEDEDDGESAEKDEDDEKEWLLQPTTSDTPRQANGSDCGVFSSMCADYLSEDLQLGDFAQRDIPRLRYRIAHSIINGRLD